MVVAGHSAAEIDTEMSVVSMSPRTEPNHERENTFSVLQVMPTTTSSFDACPRPARRRDLARARRCDRPWRLLLRRGYIREAREVGGVGAKRPPFMSSHTHANDANASSVTIMTRKRLQTDRLSLSAAPADARQIAISSKVGGEREERESRLVSSRSGRCRPASPIG